MTIEANQLLLLLNWMSPAFPAGAFAYSHGLEWAIEAGDVQSADDLRTWTMDLVTRGSGWNDAVLFARCWDDDAEELNALALALACSRERFVETTHLGRAFAIAANVFAPHRRGEEGDPLHRNGGDEGHPSLVQADARSPLTYPAAARRAPFLSPLTGGEDEIAYPIAAGTACCAMNIPKREALLAYCQGFCAALTSVAVRLVPLGQTQGLEVLRDLMPAIAAAAARAGAATLNDLGSITIAADIAAMKHETLNTRVFRT